MRIDITVTRRVSTGIVPPGLSILEDSPRDTEIIGCTLNEAHVLAVGRGCEVSGESNSTLVALKLGLRIDNLEARLVRILVPDVTLVLLVGNHDSVGVGISTSVKSLSVHPSGSILRGELVVLDGNVKTNSSNSSGLSCQSSLTVSPFKYDTPLFIVLEVISSINNESTLELRCISSDSSLPSESTLLTESGGGESK